MEKEMFSPMAIDALGEMMNISLGSSATAVSNMLDHRVDITTPTVSVVDVKDFTLGNLEPAIGVEIKYVEGLEGSNIMLLKRSDIKIMFLAALVMGIARKLLLMYGLSRTSPIDGSIIETVVPLLVLAISVVIGIDRFTRLKLAGLILGMAGAVAVILMSGDGGHERSDMSGNLMILCCAFATAFYMVWFKKLISKYRVTTVLRWVYCFAALIMFPFGGYDIVHTDYAAMDTHIVLAALFVLTVPTYLPNLMLNYSLRYVQPTVSSIYTYLQPIIAILLSVALGLDRLHGDTVVAALFIFVGVALVIRSYSAGSPLHGRPHLR